MVAKLRQRDDNGARSPAPGEMPGPPVLGEMQAQAHALQPQPDPPKQSARAAGPKGNAKTSVLIARTFFTMAMAAGNESIGLARFNKPVADQVPIFSARVQVSLRPSVLDPAGEATRAAATRLGVCGISKLRIGKSIDVQLEASDRATAQSQLELLSDRLLANPVIEDWSLELEEVGPSISGGIG